MTLLLDEPKSGCSDGDLELLQRATSTKWPDDYVAFLRTNDGGHVALNAFPVRDGLSDTLSNLYGASEVLRQRQILSDRMLPNVWPLGVTATGNFVVFVLGDSWTVGFWDHETEAITELARTFTQFAASVGAPPPPPKSEPSGSLKLAPGFAEKFAKYMKKG